MDSDGKLKKTLLAREQIGAFCAEKHLGENDISPDEQVFATDLLTLSGREAEEFGFGSKTAGARDEIVQALARRFSVPSLEVREYPETWWEKLVWFLAQPVVRAVVLMVGLLGIFIEMKTPGFGIPGIIGASCIFLFFFVSYLAALATWIEPIIFVIGVILLAIEIFLIPGFGITGILGIILMVGASVLAMQNFTLPKTSFQWNWMLENLGYVSASAIGFLAVAWTFAKYFPKTKALSGGIIAFGPAPAELHGGASKDEAHVSLVGKTGVAQSPLRPAGRAVIDSDFYDVVAQGSFIEEGTKITVAEVSGNRIVVKHA
jgi:membrane-bound serine protease (ClpP class)